MVYIKGILIGFALVGSIGMQNIYIFNNAINNRLRTAYLYSMFVWLANSTFILVAFFGFGSIINTNEKLKLAIMLIGSFLVFGLGYSIIRSAKSVQYDTQGYNTSVKKALLNALIVSWANPQAIIDGTVTLSAIRATLYQNQFWSFIFGFVSATFVWFTIITLFINLFKEKVPKSLLVGVNLTSGIILIIYGLHLLYDFFKLVF